MANQEQLAILNQGVEAWNKWRADHLDAKIDLSETQFIGANFNEADFNGANLSGADFRWANLYEADLGWADLRETILNGAYLGEAILTGANLMRVYLSEANLSEAYLNWANLSRATLSDANFERCRFGKTILGDVDLSTVKGLESAEHHGPSTIGIDTIYKSKGKIPEAFLRGAGVPEDMLPWIRELGGKAIQFYSCFISYSSKDQEFSERLHADLQSKGVRVWFAPDDMKIGDRIHEMIEDAIRIYDKLMVVLSEHSIESAWVEREVRAAIEREEKRKEKVLFPVRLDDTVMETGKSWAAEIRRSRHIGDFHEWKQHDAYQKSFARLLRDLQGKEAVE